MNVSGVSASGGLETVGSALNNIAKDDDLFHSNVGWLMCDSRIGAGRLGTLQKRLSAPNTLQYSSKPLERVSPKDAKSIDEIMSGRFIKQYGVEGVKFSHRMPDSHLSTKYNISVGAPTNQKASGRCWIFGGLNMMRQAVQQKYGEDFQYSQNYVAFWDKLERANYYFDKMITLAPNDAMDPRVLNLTENLNHDGGEWEFFRNIVEKYGLVPDYAMPETALSGSSASYTQYLEPRIREIGGILHGMAQRGASQDELDAVRKQGIDEVYSVLTKALGEPPKHFYWQGEEGKISQITPTEFATENPVDLRSLTHVTHLPYLPSGERVKVRDVGNMVGGDGMAALNLEMDEIKAAIRASIKDGKPVLFTAETAHRDKDKHYWATDTDASDALLGIDNKLRLDKGDRLKYRVTGLAHLMSFVGCDDTDTKKYDGDALEKLPQAYGPLWKVENSWKDNAEIFMSDAWLDEYLYAIVIDPKYLSETSQKTLADAWSPVTEVEAWDPLGRV